MLRALLRILLSLGGAAVAVLLVAFVEARAVAGAAAVGGEPVIPPFGGLYLAELGLLAPVALGVGGGVGVLLLLLQPKPAEGPFAQLAVVRERGGMVEKLQAASAVPVAIFALFGWTVAAAHVGRVTMAAGRPTESGLAVGAVAVGTLVVALTVALACLPLFRRLLMLGAESIPQLLDPALTGSIALIVVLLLFVTGIFMGDNSGANGGMLGIFGVLKRSELDLRPVANIGLLALGAFVVPTAFARQLPGTAGEKGHGLAFLAAGGAVVLNLALLAFCMRASGGMGDPPAVGEGIEKHAPLGKLALAALRKATDRDKDGFSASFAGGDCNDADKKINPGAIDVPGNGIDEDCSGEDTPAIAVPPKKDDAKVAQQAVKPKRTYNVILLTVDTLRPDLGFMNYKYPTSPNLDKVAEKATVFENAYSMASYTGKAVGPLLIGRYPSETYTEFSHFNSYASQNVFTAERLRDAGVRTFAGMCHWYFRPSSGLNQGFDVWDTSAIPPGMGDNDTTVTSVGMGDLALKMLQRPENTVGTALPTEGGGGPDGTNPKPFRFFAWFHFFDPHAQYVPHKDAPDFGNTGDRRTIYDEEVWFTDHHIGRVLDYIASQPWADDTAIVMTADHGEAFGEHGIWMHGQDIWNELVRVPLFVYVPGVPPQRVKEKRSHVDIAPTILELMGVPVPDDGSLRGHSLLADVLAPKGAPHEERDVYVDMPAGPYNQAKRAIIYGPTPGVKLMHAGGNAYQLFDLNEDPGEKHDLVSNKEKLKEAITRMQTLRAGLKEMEQKPK